MKDNRIYLRQIVDYIDDIDGYIQSTDFTGFENNGFFAGRCHPEN